jgi:hypothetical protein
MVGGLNFTFAPPSRLVTSFFGLGAFFYLVASVIFFGIEFLDIHHLDPKAVGFVHLFLVGFVMSVIFGAMYQLISVILEIPLFSDELAYTHLAIFGIGVVPFSFSFLKDGGFSYLGYGALILYISFILYIINIFLSIKAVKKREIKFYIVFLTHTILFIGATYGLLASFGLVHGELNFDTSYMISSHIPLVLFGFVGGLISIIATVLLPMFMLSHNFNKDISNYILKAIILASIFAILNLDFLLKATMIVAILLFVYQLYDIFIKRLRKHLDVYALDMISSGIFLILTAILIPFLGNESVVKLFMIFLFLGFLSSFVIGHIYKIVPFLVWNEKFAPLVGKEKVPMLADMVHERLSKIEFYLKLAMILVLSLGVLVGSSFLVGVGKLLFLANALLVVANVIYIFRFKG